MTIAAKTQKALFAFADVATFGLRPSTLFREAEKSADVNFVSTEPPGEIREDWLTRRFEGRIGQAVRRFSNRFTDIFDDDTETPDTAAPNPPAR